MIDTKSWRVPAGSLVVDSALVVALIWSMATTTEQVRTMNERITAIDQAHIRQNMEPRVNVLEQRANEVDKKLDKMDLKLDKIYDKLDAALK